MIALRGPRSSRAAFIIRVGVCRIGAALGTVVFIAALVDQYRTSFESLRTLAGWVRLLALAVLCIGEWVIGAGWLIGTVIWHGREAIERDRRPKP
jgi:predicted branched-subunit amino acid permease